MNVMKKTICLVATGAAVATAIPAYAQDRDGSRNYRHREAFAERHYAPHRRGYVERHAYSRHRAPVYYSAPAYSYYSQPAPVYYASPGTIAGAAVGAIVGSQLGHRGDRGATTAIGAIVGGIIGGQLR
jgi:hypothetical protein